MKSRIKSYMKELRKIRSKKKFLIEETSKGKWVFTIKKEIKDNKITLNFDELMELGFEIGAAELDHQLREIEKKANLTKEDENECNSKSK